MEGSPADALVVVLMPNVVAAVLPLFVEVSIATLIVFIAFGVVCSVHTHFPLSSAQACPSLALLYGFVCPITFSFGSSNQTCA